MDAATNPFAPGAGTRPPQLAGRDAIVRDAHVALRRTLAGRPAKSRMLLGLRGVGKTVLLYRIAELAEEEGILVVQLEAPEHRRLAEMLVPALRTILFKLSASQKGAHVARRAMAVLRAFAAAFELKVGEVEIGVKPETGTADSGNLEADLPDLLIAVAEAAKKAQKAVAIFVDEVQYLTAEDLAALIVSIHKIGQKGLPLVFFGAGLPQLAALSGDAKSYAERLFDFPEVGALDDEAAKLAIREPLRGEGVEIEPDALTSIIRRTECYPYFLQEWGSHAWNSAAESPISRADVERATKQALAALDKGFFRVRLDRLTPREKDYMRAMAELGPGPHRSGDVANELGMETTAAGPLRNLLIKKGMIWSPAHGDTAFTVPMFDEFMRRTIPDWRPGQSSAREPSESRSDRNVARRPRRVRRAPRRE